MFVKTKLKYLAILGVIIVIGVIIFAVKFPQHKENKISEMKKLNTDFTFFLYIEGDTEITYKKVEPKLAPESPTALKILICYYNNYNDKKVDYDMLISEYHDFCEGKNSYDNLLRYKDFMIERFYVSSVELRIDNFDYFLVTRVCQDQLLKEYDIADAGTDEYNSLTQEQVDAVCNKMFQNKSLMYSLLIKTHIEKYSQLDYPLLYSGFDENDAQVNEEGELYVSSENGAVNYYLQKGKVSFLDEEEGWYVNKIEIVEISGYNIYSAKIGSEKQVIANYKAYKQMFSGFEDNGDSIVFQEELIKFSLQFEDDVCSKITLELVR